jgi:ATP-binding cassette subfamily F protein uup
VLSGGERNRVILARLFTRPSNLLILDEPTNDLDVETLEVLEARLSEYAGTLIVVSHDREFLDNAVTSILVFEDDGNVHEYVGGYSDWLRRGHKLAATETPEKTQRRIAKAERLAQQKTLPRKLSYKEQRELDRLPGEMQKLEQRIAELARKTSDAAFYKESYEKTQPVLDELSQANINLELQTNRWLELEERHQQFLETKQR